MDADPASVLEMAIGEARLEAALILVSQHSSIHWEGRAGHV